MMSVLLIFSVHAEIGRANVSELHALLEHVRPEVAFLEVPATWGRENIENHKCLESAALFRYRETHSVDLVPVDLPEPPESFFINSEKLFNYLERVSDTYCRLIDQNNSNLTEGGFCFLDSELHDHIQSEIHDEILKILQMRGDPSLTQAYETWRRQNDLRDIEMISNIEKYGRKNKFARAVFIVGAAHRPSIVKKLGERFLAGLADVHWDYSNGCYK